MVCNKCGKEAKPDNRFCGFCGNDCSAQASKTKSSNINEACTGIRISTNDNIRKSNELLPDIRESNYQIKPTRKKGISIAVIISITLLSMVLVCGIYIVMNGILLEGFIDKLSSLPFNKASNTSSKYDIDNENNILNNASNDTKKSTDASINNINELSNTSKSENSDIKNAIIESNNIVAEDIAPLENEPQTEPITYNGLETSINTTDEVNPLESTDVANEVNPLESTDAVDYILPDSDRKYITLNDIIHLSPDMLRIARNEIYARHGRLFLSEDLQSYFDDRPWYRGTIQPELFQEALLNDYEKKNIELLKQTEDSIK